MTIHQPIAAPRPKRPKTYGFPPEYIKILSEVCAKHKVKRSEIMSRINDRRVTHARQEFMFRCMEEIPSATYSDMGWRMDRDHTTVSYAHKKGLADPSALEPFVSPEIPRSLRTTKRFTPQQKQIVDMVREGVDYNDIAAHFGRTRKWLITQLAEIRAKIRCMDEDERTQKNLTVEFGVIQSSKTKY